MQTEFKPFFDEHKDLYARLDYLLKELSKNKREINTEHLLDQVSALLIYVEELLNNHFEEEEEMFETLEPVEKDSQELLARILNDHQEIREKHQSLKQAYTNIVHCSTTEGDLDLQKNLLFPAYNLIATINHHAQREDNFFQA